MSKFHDLSESLLGGIFFCSVFFARKVERIALLESDNGIRVGHTNPAVHSRQNIGTELCCTLQFHEYDAICMETHTGSNLNNIFIICEIKTLLIRQAQLLSSSVVVVVVGIFTRITSIGTQSN